MPLKSACSVIGPTRLPVHLCTQEGMGRKDDLARDGL